MCVCMFGLLCMCSPYSYARYSLTRSLSHSLYLMMTRERERERARETERLREMFVFVSVWVWVFECSTWVCMYGYSHCMYSPLTCSHACVYCRIYLRNKKNRLAVLRPLALFLLKDIRVWVSVCGGCTLRVSMSVWVHECMNNSSLTLSLSLSISLSLSHPHCSQCMFSLCFSPLSLPFCKALWHSPRDVISWDTNCNPQTKYHWQ